MLVRQLVIANEPQNVDQCSLHFERGLFVHAMSGYEAPDLAALCLDLPYHVKPLVVPFIFIGVCKRERKRLPFPFPT